MDAFGDGAGGGNRTPDLLIPCNLFGIIYKTSGYRSSDACGIPLLHTVTASLRWR